MTSTLAGAISVLCIRYLHRHPLECGHLPGSAMIDLLAYSRVVASDIEE